MAKCKFISLVTALAVTSALLSGCGGEVIIVEETTTEGTTEAVEESTGAQETTQADTSADSSDGTAPAV